MKKLARDLSEGDIIDLTPALAKFGHMTPMELDHDVSQFEYAIVESLDVFPAFVVLYTDQHNLNVTSNFEFETFNAEDVYTREDRAEVAPSMDGGK